EFSETYTVSLALISPESSPSMRTLASLERLPCHFDPAETTVEHSSGLLAPLRAARSVRSAGAALAVASRAGASLATGVSFTGGTGGSASGALRPLRSLKRGS